MKKTELIAAVAEKAGITKKDAESAVAAVIDTIKEALVSDDKVQLEALVHLRSEQGVLVQAVTREQTKRLRSLLQKHLHLRPAKHLKTL